MTPKASRGASSLLLSVGWLGNKQERSITYRRRRRICSSVSRYVACLMAERGVKDGDVPAEISGKR